MNKKQSTYNGYKNWNSWNISLWINNSESLYRQAWELVQKHGRQKAARMLWQELKGSRTPDGARYTLCGIKAAIVDY